MTAEQKMARALLLCMVIAGASLCGCAITIYQVVGQ